MDGVITGTAERCGDAIQENGRPREVWLDVLKVLSAPLIVLIHTVGTGYSSTDVQTSGWLGYLFLNVLPRCAVPIFILVSGALLLGREISIQNAWRKTKIALILLVVWNGVYIFAQAVIWGPEMPIWKQFLLLPIKRGPARPLWYSYFLVWLYLFSPITSVLYRRLTDKQRRYFVLITVIIPGILDFFIKYFDVDSVAILPRSSHYMALPYLGMMFVGRMIYEADLKSNARKVSVGAALTAVASFSCMMLITWYYSRRHNSAADKFIMAEQLLAVCYGGSIMTFISANRSFFERLPSTLRKCILAVSRRSIGVYFIHQLFIWIDIGVNHVSYNDGAVKTAALAAMYYVCALASAFLLSKIPVLKLLVTMEKRAPRK